MSVAHLGRSTIELIVLYSKHQPKRLWPRWTLLYYTSTVYMYTPVLERCDTLPMPMECSMLLGPTLIDKREHSKGTGYACKR